MKMRYGFKLAAVNAMDGWSVNHIDPLVRAGVPPIVMSIDSSGPLYEAQQKMNGQWPVKPGETPWPAWSLEKQRSAALVYRHSLNDIPEYKLDPRVAAENQWAYHSTKWPKELDRRIVWFGIVNEPAYVLSYADLPQGGGPYRTKFEHNEQMVWDNSEWLAVHAYRLAELALAGGIRLHLLGWSAGTPESFQWKGPEMTKLLNLMRSRRDDLALDLHEGSMDADSLAPGVPYLIGRFRNIPAPWPSLYITEFGWALNDAPPAATGIPQLEKIYREQYAYDEVKGLSIWSLSKGPSWEGIGNIINGYMQPLTQRILTIDVPPLAEPPPIDPPDPEPPGEPMQHLLNPSFDEGWTPNATYPATQQDPKNWILLWNLNVPSWVSGAIFLLGEGVHEDTVPPAEQGVLIWDGKYSYKAFASHRPIWCRMKQTIPDLPAGKYLLRTPTFVDCFKWEGGKKNFNLEVNHAQTMIKANGVEVRPWTNMIPGERNETETVIEHVGGPLDLAVHFAAHWGVSNNGWFMDGWSMENVNVVPPPGKHMAVVVKLPQGATLAEWQKATTYSVQYQHTMTASHDDMLTILHGGNADSFVKVCWPERQPDVVEMIENAGYRWEALFANEPADPF
jgi:hypothetical protein